ncbi:MAG: DUF1573 domain-containing protein [Chitinophagales bacterium]|nr:DUF1573 domain-containing protein [Chitinophagales bacterium]
MNEHIKTFSIVVITICVFIITVIDILKLIQERNERLTVSSASSISSPNLNNPTPDVAKTIAQDISSQPITTIEFAEMRYDFGKLKEGIVVKHGFTFTNTGTTPLIISEAHGSCGCTIPSFPKEPIPPGGKGQIMVQFDSKGRSGLQNKTVTVTANTNPSQTVLNISSNVGK